MRPAFYILDDHTPVKVENHEAEMVWARFFNDAELRRVAQDFMGNDVSVSTVFLGIDHNWGDGPPLLFETMIFGGPHDGDQWRCSTWEEAEQQHAEAVRLIKGGVDDQRRA